MFKVCTIDEAKKMIGEKFSSYQLEVEEVSIFNVIGRVLASDVKSNWDVPHFNRSTVDGYAVLSKDVHGASESLPTFLKVVDEVIMGSYCMRELSQGEAIYVPTGGALPHGADCVVMIEDTEEMNGNELFVYKKVAPKENVLYLGEDIKKNETILKKGLQIRPHHLGVLSSIGTDYVKVFKKLRFSVISTGDEIVSPKEEPKIGEIRDINSYTISGRIKELGGELVNLVVLKDQEISLKKIINQSIENSDIVIISGGSSVGQKDLTYKILDEIERDSVFIHGIAIKPGKPTIFAKVRNKFVFGLPGQPASALIVLNTFINHIENVFYHQETEPLHYIEAILTKNVHSNPGRETYQMVKVSISKEGYIAEPIYSKSGTITLIANANGYIIIPASCEGLSANDVVKVYRM